MQYAIVMHTRGLNETREDAINSMTVKVNAYLNEGWELNGGLAVDKDTFYQSVKCDPSATKENN
ncbi:MAG: DUF1737 domain-containing protein [Clostridia bacterium]|nr:DUF1737 domain-containing protein [Clostridia bacterium]